MDDNKAKLAEFRVRLAAISDSVDKQNASQKAIGPGSRQAPTTVTTKNTDDNGSKGDKVGKQNSNQSSVRGGLDTKTPSKNYATSGTTSQSNTK
jgi:hypothetical protein